MPDELDTTFGRYRLLERLGEGGMAEVFKAKSFGVEGFEKILVIKRILPKLAAQARFVDMFVHEAKLAVRLSHANIVQVFDLGRAPQADGADAYFIAMEYVPGLDLASVLSRSRRAKQTAPLGLAVYVAAEVSKALDHAHRRRDEQGRPLGVVHRDISPQNVLVSWEGEVKVTDFGIAKARDELGEDRPEAAGATRGKLSYMSPEQSKAEPVDARSDLFSLGTVLYEMIAGSHPFSAPTAFETARRLGASEYPPLEILRPDCPKGLAEIVTRLLAREAKDRFDDAAQVHEQLLGWFYASGDRFGAVKLAEFLDVLREGVSSPEISPLAVLGEEPGNERTPVEVPNASTVLRTGQQGHRRSPFAEASDAAALRDFGERREVTALALAFHDGGRTGVAPACEAVGRYGGRVVERDAAHLVALFGLGDPDGRDTHAAVRAALVTSRARGGSAVSGGVHVGRVLVDAQGDVVKDERLGALVSTAQALARAVQGSRAVHSGKGLVAISSPAARLVRAEFTTEAITATNRQAPEGARVVAAHTKGGGGRFVGRHDELKRLGDVLAAATRKKPQLVTIGGDKGVGKTRLVSEMERRLAKGNYNVGFYTAVCPSNGADQPWSGLTSMLQVLCGVQEWDDEETIRATLPRLRALGLEVDEADAVLAFLGAGPGGERRAPSDQASALRSGFARMVQRLGEDRLQVFAWDDAHALDETSAQAIAHAISRGRPRSEASLRAMFIFAARGDVPSCIFGDAAHHDVHLGELAEDDASRLVAHRLGARVLPDELLTLCRERAGGHPLFLEELLRELTDTGALAVENGDVKARLEGATAAPRTLRALIAGRVSRLDAPARAVMQAAAILGEPVLLPVVAAMTGQTLPQVDKVAAALDTRDLLRVTGPTEASFASPMHGEIVLDAIPPEVRRELHAAAAAGYDGVFGEQGEHAERAARHLYEAGDRDRAATAYARAAHERLRKNQLERGVRFLVRALDLADVDLRPTGELAAWLRELADALTRLRSAPSLIDVVTRALRRIDAATDVEVRFAAHLDAARTFSSVNAFGDAFKRIDDAYELAGDRDDLRGRCLVVELESASRSGDFTRGVRAAQRIEALGDIADPRVLIHVAHVRAARGDRNAALAALTRAEAIADDLEAAAEREKLRVLVFIYCRDFPAAVAASAKAVDLARSLGVRYGVAAVLHNLGDASRRVGDLKRAYASLAESRDACEAAGHERLAMLNRAHLAYLDGLAGVATAEATLRQLIAYSDTRRFHTDALESRALLGALLRHQNKKTEARRELDEVLERAVDVGNRLVAEDAREELAALHES